MGVTKSLCSTCMADVTMGEGAVSPMETGDMIGALTGRAVLFNVDTMAEWRKLGGGMEKKEEDLLNHYFSWLVIKKYLQAI